MPQLRPSKVKQIHIFFKNRKINKERERESLSHQDTEQGKALLWVELCPPKKILRSQSTVPVNATLFGNKIFADIQIKMRPSGLPLV